MKRGLDVLVSGLGLVIFFPIILIVASVIRWRMGSPVFFRQERPGLHANAFQMIKFRTMLNAVDSDNNYLPDASRLTSLGRFLRATSLDELPELLNVFRGDMSLVGPRPLLMDYLPLYNSRQARRHDVKPGLTGWAQIHGRNSLSWQQKFELDIWYIENRTFWLDLKIIYITAIKVVRREGISATNEATMPRFDGNGDLRDGPS